MRLIKKLLLFLTLLPASCLFVASPDGGVPASRFNENLGALGELSLVNVPDALTSFNSYTGILTVSSTAADIEDTITILEAWTDTTAKARCTSPKHPAYYINLQIVGFNVYKSSEYPLEEDVTSSTPAGAAYLKKSGS